METQVAVITTIIIMIVVKAIKTTLVLVIHIPYEHSVS